MRKILLLASLLLFPLAVSAQCDCPCPRAPPYRAREFEKDTRRHYREEERQLRDLNRRERKQLHELRRERKERDTDK